MKARHHIQKKIYDGLEAGYAPVYADKNAFKARMAQYIFEAREAGYFGYSLKALKNEAMIRSLKLQPGEKVLDAGCGGGILINQLKAAYNIEGYGLDLSTLAIKRAKECGDKKIKYKNGKLEKIPFPSNYFDCVVSFDVLEHVQSKEKSLKELSRVLKPGGRMLLYAISKRDYFTWHWFLRFISFGRWGVDTEGGHDREDFVKPDEAVKILKSTGLKSVKLSVFHSFWTLMADEIIFGLTKGDSKVQKFKYSKSKPVLKISWKRVFIHRALWLKRYALEFLEIPWKLFGLGNGFFIRIQK